MNDKKSGRQIHKTGRRPGTARAPRREVKKWDVIVGWIQSSQTEKTLETAFTALRMHVAPTMRGVGLRWHILCRVFLVRTHKEQRSTKVQTGCGVGRIWASQGRGFSVVPFWSCDQMSKPGLVTRDTGPFCIHFQRIYQRCRAPGGHLTLFPNTKVTSQGSK